MLKVLIAILRYLALVLLVLAFSIASPLGGLAERLVQGLTSEAPYARLVTELGVGELVSGSVLELTELLPAEVVGYLEGREGEGGGPLTELRATLAEAIDRAIAEITAQVPAYVAGRREHLEGAVRLDGVRRRAVELAVANVPAGRLLEGPIRRAVDTAVPEQLTLERPLIALELALAPVRAAVSQLIALVDWLRHAAFLLLAAITLIGYRLSRAVRWVGIALAVGGAAGALLGGLLAGLFGLALPDVVLENRVFQDLLAGSVERFRGDAVLLVIAGAALIVVSIVLPLAARGIASRYGSCGLAPLLSQLVPRGRRADLATAVALWPALVGYGLGRGPRVRRGSRAALGGRLVAATLFDAAFPLLVLVGFGGFDGPGIVGRVILIPVGVLLVLFWALRDWPARRGGFNFIDRLAGVRRVRRPGRRTGAASLRRSALLITALAASLAVPAAAAFGAAAFAEVVALAAAWPDRTFGDLIAGTRGRAIG